MYAVEIQFLLQSWFGDQFVRGGEREGESRRGGGQWQQWECNIFMCGIGKKKKHYNFDKVVKQKFHHMVAY